MKTRRQLFRHFVLVAPFLALAPALLAQQPNITALSFTPSAIDTGSGPASVTVNFTLTGSGIAPPGPLGGGPGPSPYLYFETAFIDSTGTNVLRQSKTFGPPATGATDSVSITFPQFTAAGTYQVAYVLVADGGGVLVLPTPGDVLARFPALGNLTVTSVVDNTPPNITALSYPNSINTTGGPANLTLSFTATDNLSGVLSVEFDFTSPSGKVLSATKTFATPATSSTTTVDLTFPKNSEAGAWALTEILVEDAAKNTTTLLTADIQAKGFPMTTTVVSNTDTTPPTLNSFSFTPSTLSTNGGTVLVSFTVSDDISGANRIDVAFFSPSGAQAIGGGVNISPPVTTPAFSGTIQLNFPLGTELGSWSPATIFLSDAAGNTKIVNQPISFTVNLPGADTTPPLIIPAINPLPNVAGWNNSTPVTVTWAVSDPESGVASSTGCGPTTISTATTGTAVTCMATNGVNLSSSATVVVKIDTSAPVTSNLVATPDPVIINNDVTITATVTDTGGSNVMSAEFNVDGGPFDDLAAAPPSAFGMSTVNVSLLLPGSATAILQTPGVHNICVRGTDFASNVGATQCVLFAVYDPNGGFATGGGGTDSPAGADLVNPAGSGPVTFAFNPKYLPNNSTVPAGDLEFHYNAGNINFKSTGWDFLVITNGNRGQAQGTGTINGTSVCKFSLDAWSNSFQPGNVNAFGLTIFNCDGGTGNRYSLATTPTTKGNIVVHQ